MASVVSGIFLLSAIMCFPYSRQQIPWGKGSDPKSLYIKSLYKMSVLTYFLIVESISLLGYLKYILQFCLSLCYH